MLGVGCCGMCGVGCGPHWCVVFLAGCVVGSARGQCACVARVYCVVVRCVCVRYGSVWVSQLELDSHLFSLIRSGSKKVDLVTQMMT